MFKKIVLILGILIIIALAAFFILFGNDGTGEQSDGRVGFSLRDYFPFGRDTSGGEKIPNDNQSDNGGSEDFYPVTENTSIPRLRKISSEPVAGAVIMNQGTSSIVRFVERGTGNVYEARSDSNNIERLTNTTIPKIVRAYWLPDGSGFLAQTITLENEIVETSFVKLNRNVSGTTDESITPYSTSISRLPTNIKELSISPDGKKILYYTNSGTAKFYISNPDGTGEKLVATHPLTEWLLYWNKTNIALLQVKADSSVTSYTYNLNIDNGSITKNSFGFRGLTINPQPKKDGLLISVGGPKPALNFKNDSGEYSQINTSTLAEKCAWNHTNTSLVCAIPNFFPQGRYPEYWYKGLISTEDFLIEIDPINSLAYNTADLVKESGQKIDVENISISSDDSHLIFRNKIDGFLWLLRKNVE